MKLSIAVEGLPPKKDGANSMWRKPSELARITALRVAAVRAAEEAGHVAGRGDVRLALCIFADRSAGDLDNFVTGVCDALMAAHPRVLIDLGLWESVPEAARPTCRSFPR